MVTMGGGWAPWHAPLQSPPTRAAMQTQPAPLRVGFTTRATLASWIYVMWSKCIVEGGKCHATPLHNNPCQWDLGVIFRLRCWTRQAQHIIATMQRSTQLVWLKNNCTQCSWDLYTTWSIWTGALQASLCKPALLQSITKGTSWKDTCILTVKQPSRWSLLQKWFLQRKLQVYQSSHIWHILAFGMCPSPSGMCICNLSG